MRLFAVLLTMFMATSFLVAEEQDFDFGDAGARDRWIGLTNYKDLKTLGVSTYFENSVSVALHQMFKEKNSKWDLHKYANYSGNLPWPSSWLRAQISQKPYARQDILRSGMFFISKKGDLTKKMVVSLNGPENAYILYNNGNEWAGDLAEELYADLKAHSTYDSIYRGAVLEYKPTGKVGFFDKAETNNHSWDQFIYDNEEKEQIRTTIDGFIKNYNYESWKKFGLPLNRGVLLYGPPGTGKSFIGKVLISQVIRGDYGKSITYLHVQARHIVSRESMRNIYNTARMMNPAIIFFEDVDLIAGTHRKHKQAIKNEFMQQLSGLEKLHGVLTIATTNLGDLIDPALRRSKRLGYHFEVGYPKISERRALLDIFASKLELADDVNLESIADASEGMSGADLKELMNLASEIANSAQSISSTSKKLLITGSHFDEAMALRKRTKLGKFK